MITGWAQWRRADATAARRQAEQIAERVDADSVTVRAHEFICGGDGGGMICGGPGAFVSWLTIATAYREPPAPALDNNARRYLRPAIPLSP